MTPPTSIAEPAIGFISLGCPKNLVDSERIITKLRSDGYKIVPDYANANLVIVNTCAFINDAITESLETIGEAIEENGQVLVTGCLGKQKHLITNAHPKVLDITGPHEYEAVVQSVHKHLPITTHPHLSLVPETGIKLTPKHYAYLKISEGCNNTCTFCIIPSLRGKLKSRPIDDVLREATLLARAGTRELLIISQDTSAYGVDLRYVSRQWQDNTFETRLIDLAQALSQLNVWIRLHYVYPYPHVDKLIPLMAEGKLLPYLDIPLQHASPHILKKMKRPANATNMLTRIQAWRQICPDLHIRSTFIVGFPGETEDDFNMLLDFIESAQLDRVGCFAYSEVDGAKANALEQPVPEEVKQTRLTRFMEIQSRISADKLQQKIGTLQDIIIDKILPEEGLILGRTRYDAPEVDGIVGIEMDTNTSLQHYQHQYPIGSIITVKITDADEHDLTAEIL